MLREPLSIAVKFLYGQAVPLNLEIPLIILLIYVLHLLFSAIILYYSVKISSGKVSFIIDMPKAIFTIFVRDLIALPLILMTFFFPFVGIIIGLLVWLSLIKYTFQLNWVQTTVAFIVSLIIPLIIILFLIIPIALILSPGLF